MTRIPLNSLTRLYNFWFERVMFDPPFENRELALVPIKILPWENVQVEMNRRSVKASADRALPSNRSVARLLNLGRKIPAIKGYIATPKIREYTVALELDPNHPDAQHNLALLLAGAGRVDEAVEHYRIALRLQPNFPEAQFNWANAVASVRPQEAIEHYKAAIQLLPDYTDAYANLASVYAQLGDRAQAATTMGKAVELAKAQHNEPLSKQLEQLLYEGR